MISVGVPFSDVSIQSALDEFEDVLSSSDEWVTLDNSHSKGFWLNATATVDSLGLSQEPLLRFRQELPCTNADQVFKHVLNADGISVAFPVR